MKYLAFISFLLFAMCSNDNSKQVSDSENQNTSVEAIDKEENKPDKSPFAGKFSGNSNGIISSAEIKVKGNNLDGILVINGQSDGFDGIIDGNTCNGIIHDTEVSKEYSFVAQINEDQFVIAFTLPEMNNQVLTLAMQRDTESKKASNNPSGINNKEKNPMLVGTWRNNETFSSGSGDSYMSFSTDYFMQFNADGTALSWTGASAGMTTSAKSNEDNPDHGTWYTEGETLYLKDDASGQDATTLYSCDGSRLMLHNGGSEKKIFERVR
ncbi:MAG: lipocalin family protein [Saprospiraceae bacterium]|nr:lipocalin family protein [Candidatus Brachybacter algidus]